MSIIQNFYPPKALSLRSIFFGGKLHEAGVDIDAENNEKLARKFVSEQKPRMARCKRKQKLLMLELKQKKLELYFGIKCVS